MNEETLRRRAQIVLVTFVGSSASLLGSALAYQRTSSRAWLGILLLATLFAFILRLVERRIHPSAPAWSEVLASAGMNQKSHRYAAISIFYALSLIAIAAIAVSYLTNS